MIINESKSKEIAKQFLEQYHSIIVTDAVLKQNVWSVSARAGIAFQILRKVRIDATTGRILDYS